MTLRGAAIVYLGAMVALPVAAVITKGFGDGLEGLRSALNVPGAVAAIPSFLLAVGLVWLFAVTWSWFPVAGLEGVSSYVLPVAALAHLVRFGRSSAR